VLAVCCNMRWAVCILIFELHNFVSHTHTHFGALVRFGRATQLVINGVHIPRGERGYHIPSGALHGWCPHLLWEGGTGEWVFRIIVIVLKTENLNLFRDDKVMLKCVVELTETE
jgi:hypothetical protein